MALLNARSADTGKLNATQEEHSRQRLSTCHQERVWLKENTQNTREEQQYRHPKQIQRSRREARRGRRPRGASPSPCRSSPSVRAHTPARPAGRKMLCFAGCNSTRKRRRRRKVSRRRRAAARWRALQVIDSRGEQRRPRLVPLLHLTITWPSSSSCRASYVYAAKRKVEGKRTKRVAHCLRLTATPSGHDDGCCLSRATACYSTSLMVRGQSPNQTHHPWY